MKKILDAVLCIPLIGLLSIYLYVLATMISINSTAFYKIDPKNSPVAFLYDILIVFPIIGFLSILFGLHIVLMDYFHFKGKLISKPIKYIYFLGSILTIFTYYVDIGYCQIWFFD